MKLRISKKNAKRVVTTGILSVVLTASFSFLVYRLENNKLIHERSKYQKIIDQKQVELDKYQTQSRSGWILTKELKAGDEVKSEDIKQTLLPDYFTPTNVLSNRDDIIGKVIKINALSSTVLTNEMLFKDGALDQSERKEETEYVRLPVKLQPNDTVDIRIVYPNGEDYIVLSKKKLSDFNYEKQQSFFQDNEEEALLLQSALVDAYLHSAELYMRTYVEPELQDAAPVTYVPNQDVLNEIKTNPLIVDQAKWKLSDNLRKSLESRLSKIDPVDTFRIGAEAPAGSAVGQLKSSSNAPSPNEASNPDAQTNASGEASQAQDANPSLMQPNNSANSHAEASASNDSTGVTSSNLDKSTVYPNPSEDVPNVTGGK